MDRILSTPELDAALEALDRIYLNCESISEDYDIEDDYFLVRHLLNHCICRGYMER